MTANDVSSGRWVDHVGITVPNIEEATRYFEQAFGATVIYDTWPRGSEPFGGPDLEQLVGVPPGTELITFRMLQLPLGPGIELFEYVTPGQRPPISPGDLGLQHFAVYVDDIDEACRRVERAGGRVLSGPSELGGPESGSGNQWCYTRTPWEMTIELIAVPAPMAHEKLTSERRWHPGRTGPR